jgi:two-component system nitrogen regulation sensor histidine kinase GlnL
MAGAIFIPSTFLHFSLTLIGQRKKYLRIITFWYFISLLFLVLDFTPLFVKDVKPRLFFPYWPTAGIIYTPFLAMFIGLTIYAHVLMFKSYRRLSGFLRNQIKYVFLGTAIGFIGGSTNYLLWYDIPIPPLGNVLVAVYVFLVAYAIIKYRLMDIKVALTRVGIFAVVYALVLGIPFWIGYKYNLWQYSTWIMLFLATLGPFIYIYLNRRAEERLLKEQKRYQETLKQASAGMTRIRNLRKLLSLIAHIVTRTVKISYIGIYLYNQEAGEYVIQVSRDKGRIPVSKLAPDNTLIKWIVLHRQPIIYEEIKRLMHDTRDPTYQLLADNMQLLTAAVIIPSFLEDRFMGFFVLGDKISGQIYTPEDLNVFQVLASQAALAIENAKFYEDAKQMQDQIAQAEKMATIGTMADGLSHQINNRFYALSIIAADTIDTVKMTDTSKCSPEIKEMINQINHALERIKENVMQGGQVVKGLLKYTRKGEEGLEALTLDQIIDQALDMAQYKISLSGIDILRNYPKDTPKVRGNSVQLQEALFNFIDNAYDSTVERKALLREDNYRGKIAISAYPNTEGMLEIVIEDNGIGVKEESKRRVFTPFFTTKVSSRMGTGLGLYVIKRIIEEFHKGKIWFESEYGKGTKFFIQLPIA